MAVTMDDVGGFGGLSCPHRLGLCQSTIGFEINV